MATEQQAATCIERLNLYLVCACSRGSTRLFIQRARSRGDVALHVLRVQQLPLLLLLLLLLPSLPAECKYARCAQVEQRL